MNRTKIEWCDYTWNPITGCRNGCEYCYARVIAHRFCGNVRLNKMAKRDYTIVPQNGYDTVPFLQDIYVLDKGMADGNGGTIAFPFGFEPTLHTYRLDDPKNVRNGSNIFVGSMTDVFGADIPDEWIYKVFDACGQAPQHRYIFLTKNPSRYNELKLPAEMWYGVSITRRSEMSLVEYLPKDRNVFAVFEPILEDLQPELYSYIFKTIKWLIIGAETGRNKNKTIPKKDWIDRIVFFADKHKVPVFMKDSLKNQKELLTSSKAGDKSPSGYFSGSSVANLRQEFPLQLCENADAGTSGKLYAKCGFCGEKSKKSDMTELLYRTQRGSSARQICRVCPKCFENFLQGDKLCLNFL